MTFYQEVINELKNKSLSDKERAKLKRIPTNIPSVPQISLSSHSNIYSSSSESKC